VNERICPFTEWVLGLFCMIDDKERSTQAAAHEAE
jgi:hypothetical protein